MIASPPPAFADAVRHAAGRADVRQAIAALYAEVQASIEARRPVCRLSGRCCRFDEFGHRLYVTTLELAAFLADLPGPPPDPAASPGGCPFQRSGLCTVHAARPFGCRIFFCDAAAAEWQREAYERFHGALRKFHGELDVPYYYVEWRQALAALGEPPPTKSQNL